MNLKLSVKLYSQILCGLSLTALLLVPAFTQSLSWIQQLGTSASDAKGVATDSYGNAYISGYTYGALGGTN